MLNAKATSKPYDKRGDYNSYGVCISQLMCIAREWSNARYLNNRTKRLTATFVCLFDLILYVHSTIFQLCGTGLPGLNQY